MDGYMISKYAMKAAIFLVAAIFFISGCSTITAFEPETTPIKKSDNKYESVFQKNDNSIYLLDFISQKDQAVLSGPEEIHIIDLRTGNLIKKLLTPDSQITSCYIANNDKNLFLFTTNTMQEWDTNNWKLTRQLKATKYHPNRLSGHSENEELLYFADAIWSQPSFTKMCESVDGTVPNGYAFSPDNLYFVSAGHYGISITDIKAGKWSGITYFGNGATQASFRDNNSFYASYGAKLDITKGGYLPEELGLFSVKKKERFKTFSPSSRISCWVNSHDSGLLVSLYNGDIYLLNQQFDIQTKWHIDDHVNVCSRGGNGDIWLGTEKSGLYKADLDKLAITHEYKTSNSIFKLKVSSDSRYLGFEEEILPGGTLTKILDLNQTQPSQ
jgi:hypothetical protein